MARRNVAGRVSQYSFAQVPTANIPRSVFNRSHTHKTTFHGDELIPVFIDEALPGDTMSMKATFFGRMATPIYPVMDNMYIETFFFAVPVRLVWDNWQKFHGEQVDPGDSIDFQVPTMTESPVSFSLSEYMGVPIQNTLTFSSLWHRAYNLIWNEWFRDENLQDSVVVDKDDGPDTSTDYVLLKRGKRHDYFTSCLPFAQKGTAVELPLGTTADVVADATGIPTFDLGTSTDVRLRAGTDQDDARWSVNGQVGFDAAWNTTGLEVDLTSATAATINQIREAFQIQRLLERDARGGTRYTEIIRSHFGVMSPDQRLQRPEFLGGSSNHINTTPVARVQEPTTPSGDKQPLGRLAGFTTFSGSASWVKSFTEHCLLIGLANVRADLTYQQGLERMFSRSTRYDFYYPAFAHLGEQEVLNKEIFADGSANDDLVFGYQERWAEYRYKPSRVSGQFRSDVGASSLDPWHLSIDFGSLPSLNATFIEGNSPWTRVQAVTNLSDFIADFGFNYRCARPMPTFSVPGLIDHF